MPLNVRKFSHRLNMVITIATSIFFQITLILTDNKNKHKISAKLDFGLNRIIHLGVMCP